MALTRIADADDFTPGELDSFTVWLEQLRRHYVDTFLIIDNRGAQMIHVAAS